MVIPVRVCEREREGGRRERERKVPPSHGTGMVGLIVKAARSPAMIGIRLNWNGGSSTSSCETTQA